MKNKKVYGFTIEYSDRQTEKGEGVPETVSFINNQNKPRNQKSEKSKTTRSDTQFTMICFYEEVKIILWSIRTFWYKDLANK